MLRDTLSTKAHTARTLVASGMFAPVRPDRTARALVALRRWGPTVAAGYAASAIRYPDAIALVDDRGSLTFADVQRRTNALAHAWRDAGLAEGDGVAILCRNHRGFVEATVACSKLGADALFLNTAFAGPQLAAVCARERPRAIVYDDEFAAVVERGRGRLAALRRVDARRAPATRGPAGRRAARAAGRVRRHERADGARAGGARGDPHERHDRPAEGRGPPAARRRWIPSRRCCRRSRCAHASAR